MAVNWLDQCRRNCNGEHDTCIAKDPLWLPTRLLDLSHANPGGSVPVVSRENRPELFAAHHEYITLSHCWGDWREAGLPRLLEENKDQYEREGVLFDDLPPLLRDAMEIAQWFNVRWLWMDSLCIVQDSPSMADWNREAPLMCKVYKHGLLNISADASDDARSGCLHDRPAAQWIAKAPLSQRAWVFQERHLARRALHLTKHEVLWECCPAKPYIACETLSTGHDQKARHRAWLDLCEDYSARALSFEKDRLPALAGLAAEFADLIPEDRYVVGFWSSALPAVLLWSSKRRVRQKGVRAAYVAPSWSWLSSCSAVRFDTETDTSIQHIIANVIDINVTPSTPSPFAMVQPGASIELRGFV
ncbi:HET-domain-containing protein, partial [Cryphonectria parasitica EP155]